MHRWLLQSLFFSRLCIHSFSTSLPFSSSSTPSHTQMHTIHPFLHVHAVYHKIYICFWSLPTLPDTKFPNCWSLFVCQWVGCWLCSPLVTLGWVGHQESPRLDWRVGISIPIPNLWKEESASLMASDFIIHTWWSFHEYPKGLDLQHFWIAEHLRFLGSSAYFPHTSPCVSFHLFSL